MITNSNLLSKELSKEIEEMIKSHEVVLFMKGTKYAPECGFSDIVIQILHYHKIDFLEFNVLINPALREGIKIYSKWPTIPQIYINSHFIGGSDILKTMHQNEIKKENPDLKNTLIIAAKN